MAPQASGLSHHNCKSQNDDPEWDSRYKTQSADAQNDGEDRYVIHHSRCLCASSGLDNSI